MSATTATNATRDPRNWVLLGLALIALTLARSAVDRWLAADGATSAQDATASQSAVRLVSETNGAIAFWEERIVRDPQDFTAYNKLGGLYLRRVQQDGDISDYTRAQVAYESSVDLLPTYEAEVELVYIYNSKHEFTKASSLAGQLVKRYPDKEFGWAVLGDAQLALGEYDEAERSYSEMLRIQPSLASFSRMAQLAETFGDLDRAELDWLNALSVDYGDMPETTAWTHVQFGLFQFKRGDLDAAEDSYRASLEAYPDNVHGIAGLAAVRAARGDDDEAIALYEQVVVRNPLPIYVIALGDLYARDGRQVEADRQYALVRAIGQLYDANGIRSVLPLIVFEADHGGDPADVLSRAEVAYQERPSLWASDAYGWALYHADRFDDARAQAETALSFGTQDPLLYFHAGMIAWKQGDTAAATEYLATALRLNPQFHVLQADEARAALQSMGAS